MVSVSRLRRSAALGAGDVHKLRHAAQRRSALLRDLDLLGQHHRQLIVGHRHQAVALAVNHGNGRAPVALAAHAPVLQAEGDRWPRRSRSRAAISWSFFCASVAAQPVELAGVDQHAVFGEKRQLPAPSAFGRRARSRDEWEWRTWSQTRSRARRAPGTLMMAPVP